MIDSLLKIFNSVELSWIDTSNEILTSNEFYDLISIFPNLKEIFKEAVKSDEFEFQRTVRHTFRLFKIFFLLKDGAFSHDTLSKESIQKIKVKLMKQHSYNKLFIPIILMYHDIGRFINKKEHPYHSFLLISKKKLLEPFELLDIEKLLITKVIQYHLLFATIYTGESTFYGIYSLLNDDDFIELLSHESYSNRFIELLEIFTFIDILGYSYARIFDHYLKFYDKINWKLKEILKYWESRDIALKKANEYSQEWLEWRLAGALRIFQFVETKPHLTKEFYFNKLKESIKETNNELISKLNWEILKSQYLIHSYKIQIKYGLPFLMILAFGNFQRMGLKIDAGISYKLILFWTLLSKEIVSRTKDKKVYLWNVYLVGMPHWSKIDKIFINKLNDNAIELIIKNASQEFIKERKEYNLYLNLKQIID